MKKYLIVCSLITVLAMSACTMQNQASIVTEEAEEKGETEKADPETETDPKEEEPAQTDQTEAEEEAEEPGRTEVDLREKLITEGNLKEEEIRSFRQDDFDGDGAEEAFALVAGSDAQEYDDGQTIEGEIWFVSPEECKKLLSSEGWGFGKADRVLQLGNRKYELYDDETGFRSMPGAENETEAVSRS